MGLLVARNSQVLLLLMTIIFKIPVAASDCTSERHNHLESIQSCLAVITCSETSSNFQSEYQKLSNSYIRNNNYNNDYDYNDNYNYNFNNRRTNTYYCGTIYLVLQLGSSSENLLTIKSYDETNHFIKYLKITNDESALLPTAAMKHFKNLKEISATDNSFEVLSLNELTSLTNLLEIDFSNNKINVIQSDYQLLFNGQLSNVVLLNLSYNLLESLPNECFTYFNKLQTLDVSHNLLTSLEILTFEGIKQLVTLNLSHNRLIEIGHSFARFSNLKDLNLNDNQLTLIQDINFKTMAKLETLNISSNQIKFIDSSSFIPLSSILVLDLSFNKIDILGKNIFRNNSNLHSLFISDNNLTIIEPEALVGSNITYFDFSKNCLTGLIDNKTFQGINVAELDLSNSRINGIGPRAFEPLQNNLRVLNLTKNIISIISNISFHALESLTVLDLSNNLIDNLEFDKKDLINLNFFNASKNIIREIKSDSLIYLKSLKTLDLSFNIINSIDGKLFKNLTNLEFLILKGNTLVSTFQSHSFEGLILLNTIELMFTRTEAFQDETFTGLHNLEYLNSSHGELANIAHNLFNETESLEILDLSYNMLTSFSINTTGLSNLKELYLNNNQISNISKDIFVSLVSLIKFDISLNNVLNLENTVGLKHNNIVFINLAYNLNVKLNCTFLEHKESLNYVSLSHVQRKFNFEQCSNISISKLDLTSCEISEINSVFVFRVKQLSSLKMGFNKITSIDKLSFQQMPLLTYLDLSFNMISSIQPGSFMFTHMLNDLDLCGNNLESLRFGIFDNLKHLHVLNISNNVLHSLEADLFHNIPKLTLLVLDNNVIENIEIESFSDETAVMSIGENLITCNVLVRFFKQQSEQTSLLVTANVLNFHAENVRGISCKSIKNMTLPLEGFSNNNSTNLTIAVAVLSNTIQSFIKAFKSDTSNLTSTLSNVISLNADTLKEKKSSEASNVSYLKELVRVSNITNTYFAFLDNYIKDKSNINTILKDTNTTSEGNMTDYNNMLQDLKMMFQNWENKNAKRANLAEMSNSLSKISDVTVLLYFIAICLATLLIVLVFSKVYNRYRNRQFVYFNSANGSRQPMSDCSTMEME